jgi:hypothetical protein
LPRTLLLLSSALRRLSLRRRNTLRLSRLRRHLTGLRPALLLRQAPLLLLFRLLLLRIGRALLSRIWWLLH